MTKWILLVVSGLLALTTVSAMILYRGEIEKNQILRQESSKTSGELETKIKKLKEDIKIEREKSSEEKKKLLEQLPKLLKERDGALQKAEELKKSYSEERQLSLIANDDLDKLRAEVAKLRKERQENVARIEKEVKERRQNYETRILSLEAQLEKAKTKLNSEAERYHYNLGVAYTQSKDFDSAVTEFKKTLEYNPRNTRAHYNLGIIFDDYFKDKQNARYHYRRFLELAPESDDAESVQEWLANLDR